MSMFLFIIIIEIKKSLNTIMDNVGYYMEGSDNTS